MTVVLALDCALGACSVALMEDTHLCSHEHHPMERGHAEALMPMIDAVLAAADRRYRQLDVVAATVGPGSFTGVRIGLAAARGLALAVSAKTVAVTTLEAIAAAIGERPAASSGRPLCVVIDSKRGDAYGQWFDPDGRPLGNPIVAPFPDLVAAAPSGDVMVAGDARDRFLEAARRHRLAVEPLPGIGGPDARVIARLAGERYAAFGDSALRPLYLRAPETGSPAA